MADQKTLFDLDDIPPVKQKIYAVYEIRNDGRKAYLWKSHSDSTRWIFEDALNKSKRIKPKLMTYRAARMRIKEFSTPYYAKRYQSIGMEIWERVYPLKGDERCE